MGSVGFGDAEDGDGAGRKRVEIAGAAGSAEEKSLADVTAELLQLPELARRLDALGDAEEVE